MIKPATYAEWSDCIDAFELGEQDDNIVITMSGGTLNWNSGVATLFSERISSAFSARLQRCAHRMERDFRTGGDETTVVRALLDTRRTLTLLHRVATIPPFPDMLQEHLAAEVRRYAERAQQSLEDSSRHDRSGRLASLMRNNSLLCYEQVPEETLEAAEAVAEVASPAPFSSGSKMPEMVQPARVTPFGKMPPLGITALVILGVAVGFAWIAMRGKDSVSNQKAAVELSAPQVSVSAAGIPEPKREVVHTVAPEPPPGAAEIAPPLEKAPLTTRPSPKSVAAAPEPSPQPPVEPIRSIWKRDRGPYQENSSKASAIAAIIDEGEACFDKKKFDCAINAAEAALRLHPGYIGALDLKRRAETGQKRALDSISIN